MDSLIEKIKNMELSKVEVQIANYILNQIDTVGMMTSSSLAQVIGVSDTSVIRFIRKLGFEKYGDFRKQMNEQLTKRYEAKQNAQTPSAKYRLTKERLQQSDFMEKVSGWVLNNIEGSLLKITPDLLQQITRTLLQSQHIYVAGFRGTVSCVMYLCSKLNLLLPHVQPITHADSSALETMVDIGKQDCLFLISFSRYSEMSEKIIRIAKQNGSKIILQTDYETAPFARYADLLLTAKVEGMGFTNSYIAPFCIIELIILALTSANIPSVEKRLNQLDALVVKEKLY